MSDSPAEQVITEKNVMKCGDPNDRYAFNSLSPVVINPFITQILGINIVWLPIGTPYTLPKCCSYRCCFTHRKNKLRFALYLDEDDTVEQLYHYVAYNSAPALKMYIKFMSDAEQHDI